ncbi:MAG: ATP-binding cassette domain-containing protein [Burkholderiales bacterium]|jgi:ABC-2 type transport system ATP-binding protein|nr:ATP-binding cassette domain-containing protein [Burkholderiales bacterium]
MSFRALHLKKTFRQKNGAPLLALDDVSLTLKKGTITALVGPDGAGKTTLIRILAGLLKPDLPESSNAEAILNNQHRIGYMPQKFGLYEDLSVEENMNLYAALLGVPDHARDTQYQTLLAMADLSSFRTRRAGKLSGGMKQKLGLICALLAAPEVLLLDEPTVGVDPLSRRELKEIIKKLTEETGMSVLMSTAYLDEADRCDEVILMFQGKVLASGSPQTLRALSKGRCYWARPHKNETPRALQSRLLEVTEVIDAVPMGGGVRLITDNLKDGQRALSDEQQKGATLTAVDPTLEDSFMALLHQHAADTKDKMPIHVVHHADNRDPTHEQTDWRARPMQDREIVINVDHVSRYFGDFCAVNDVSFSVREGEVFGLLGPNGAGKTTTFRMLCGLLPASHGSLFVAGCDVRAARHEARRKIGYVAQKFSLYGALSVAENLSFFAGAYGLTGAYKKRRIDAMVEDFALASFLLTPAEQLLQGYKQRLAMAVGLLHEPAILFLDEPTGSVDPIARRAFWQRITQLSDHGMTIVITTHFMDEAEYCDRVLIQDRGAMLALDTPEHLREWARRAHRPATMEEAFIEIVKRGRQ